MDTSCDSRLADHFRSRDATFQGPTNPVGYAPTSTPTDRSLFSTPFPPSMSMMPDAGSPSNLPASRLGPTFITPPSIRPKRSVVSSASSGPSASVGQTAASSSALTLSDDFHSEVSSISSRGRRSDRSSMARSIPRAPRALGTSIPPLPTGPFRGDTLEAFRTAVPRWYRVLLDSCRLVHSLVIRHAWPVVDDTVARSIIQAKFSSYTVVHSTSPEQGIDSLQFHLVSLTEPIWQPILLTITCKRLSRML